MDTELDMLCQWGSNLPLRTISLMDGRKPRHTGSNNPEHKDLQPSQPSSTFLAYTANTSC
jgi:hypothetical protein